MPSLTTMTVTTVSDPFRSAGYSLRRIRGWDETPWARGPLCRRSPRRRGSEGGQPTKLVDMAVEVVRQERYGVLVPGMTERAARVDADEEGVARFRLSRIGGPSRRCRGHDAGGGERRGEDPPLRGHRAADRDLHSWGQDWDGGQ